MSQVSLHFLYSSAHILQMRNKLLPAFPNRTKVQPAFSSDRTKVRPAFSSDRTKVWPAFSSDRTKVRPHSLQTEPKYDPHSLQTEPKYGPYSLQTEPKYGPHSLQTEPKYSPHSPDRTKVQPVFFTQELRYSSYFQRAAKVHCMCIYHTEAKSQVAYYSTCVYTAL